MGRADSTPIVLGQWVPSDAPTPEGRARGWQAAPHTAPLVDVPNAPRLLKSYGPGRRWMQLAADGKTPDAVYCGRRSRISRHKVVGQ